MHGSTQRERDFSHALLAAQGDKLTMDPLMKAAAFMLVSTDMRGTARPTRKSPPDTRGLDAQELNRLMSAAVPRKNTLDDICLAYQVLYEISEAGPAGPIGELKGSQAAVERGLGKTNPLSFSSSRRETLAAITRLHGVVLRTVALEALMQQRDPAVLTVIERGSPAAPGHPDPHLRRELSALHEFESQGHHEKTMMKFAIDKRVAISRAREATQGKADTARIFDAFYQQLTSDRSHILRAYMVGVHAPATNPASGSQKAASRPEPATPAQQVQPVVITPPTAPAAPAAPAAESAPRGHDSAIAKLVKLSTTLAATAMPAATAASAASMRSSNAPADTTSSTAVPPPTPWSTFRRMSRSRKKQ